MKNALFISFFIIIPYAVAAQQKTDYLKILRNAADYNKHDSRKIPPFIYESANDANLVALREKFHLDSIAGTSTDVSRILNLLHWVHNTVNHDGIAASLAVHLNANEIITQSRARKIGVSCGELATILNDCYLAMGFKSRKVYCYPQDSLQNDPDSHVINIVYLESKKKWIWTDPTNDAYIMDNNGELLSIEEVRKKLINNRPMIVTPEANLNGSLSVTQDDYLAYMSKNLYCFYCPLNSEFDYETPENGKTIIYVGLLPINYGHQNTFKTAENNIKIYETNNASIFWQMPGDMQ